MLDKVMEWTEAVTLGLKKYRYKRPCRRGHEPIRYVKSNCCVKCVNLPYHKRKGRDITPEVINSMNSRENARLQGLKKYATGKPCVNGHVALRYTESGSCSACIAEHGRKGRAGRYYVMCHINDREAIRKFAESLLKLRDAGLR